MKKLIVSLAGCALVVPLALAGGSKETRTRPWHIGFVDRGVTVTAPGAINLVAGGEVTGYQPAGTVVIQQDGAGRFVLDAPGRIFNRRGDLITASALRPGTRVQVYFVGDGNSKTIDRVVAY